MALRVYVCELGDIADDQLRAFRVRGVTWPVVVTRVGGELYAVPGVCPHDDVGLDEYGELDVAHCELSCRVHGYRFDLKTGACEHNPKLHLRRYPITQVGEQIWVDLL